MKTHRRRVQVLLDEARYQKLVRHANAQGISLSSVLREAIDEFAASPGSKQEHIETILSTPAIRLPAPHELKQEIEETRPSRFRE